VCSSATFVVYNADAKYASIISGIPEHPIESVRLSNIRIYYQGGYQEQAALDPPEKEKDYPEPVMFGEMPAYGFFIRHVDGIQMDNVEVSYMEADARPAFVLSDVKHADFFRAAGAACADVPTFSLRDVEDFWVQQSANLPDKHIDRVKQGNSKEKFIRVNPWLIPLAYKEKLP